MRLVMVTQKNKYLPFFMWSFPLVFFTYQFILRLWPGLMMHQIMEQFSIDATGFGCIAAFYYYGYAGAQIPVAFLLDRFPARYVVCAFAVLCGISTLIFTYSSSFYLACLSRFFIGAGSAVGFLGVSKVVSEWFPQRDYSRMIGYSFTIGLLGAIYGGKPISLLTETYPWRTVATVVGVLAIVVGFATLVVLRPKVKDLQQHIETTTFKLTDFKKLLSSPTLWLLAVANLLMVGALEGFSDVWGVPYLVTAFSISKSDAAQLISFVFFGMLFGGPLLAMCSKKFGNYTVIAFCGFWMALAFTLLLLSSVYHWWLLALLFFGVGIMCCYQVIVFAAGSELVKPHYLGITVAFLNCINMLGGSFFHTLIGVSIDHSWTGELSSDGVKLYGLPAYKTALMLIPICASLGAVIICFLRYKAKKSSLLRTFCS